MRTGDISQPFYFMYNSVTQDFSPLLTLQAFSLHLPSETSFALSAIHEEILLKMSTYLSFMSSYVQLHVIFPV